MIIKFTIRTQAGLRVHPFVMWIIMVGGQIVQVLNRETGVFIEVVEAEVGGITRCWRICDIGVDVQLKDQLWWQSWTGFVSRDGQFEDKNIGSCKPADHPGDCDHEWKVVDSSFDHEYGCEQIVFERCEFCDAEQDYEPT